MNFAVTVPAYNPEAGRKKGPKPVPVLRGNPQTDAFLGMLKELE